MRFLLDEGLPVRLAKHLRETGHDVSAIGEDHPFSLTDREILEIASTERRVILTNDKDFGDLIFRDRLHHAGVILFRMGYVPLEVRISHLERVLAEHTDQLDQLIVVTLRGIRVSKPGTAETSKQAGTKGGGSS